MTAEICFSNKAVRNSKYRKKKNLFECCLGTLDSKRIRKMAHTRNDIDFIPKTFSRVLFALLSNKSSTRLIKWFQ